MRIALHAHGEVGTRTGRILLAEPNLSALGLYGQTGSTEDRRTMAVRSLAGFEMLVTDAPDARGFALIAADEGISCVVAADIRIDRRLARRFRDTARTLLLAAGLAGEIAETLAAHELARNDVERQSVIAWTEPGRPLRRGEGIPFPEPVGPRWGRRHGPRWRRGAGRHTSLLVAPVDGQWAGAVVRVSGHRRGAPVEQVVGVADQRPHLEAIALASGALAVSEGAYPPGIHRPAAASETYLAAALRVGLGVASYTVGA